VGVLLATLFVFSVYGFAGDRQRSRITSLAFFYAALMSAAGGVSAFAKGLSPRGIEILWGAVTNVQLLAFYAAPLSTIGSVLRARDAASIAANWPMTAVSAANAALWAAYGFAIGRPFVWAPNVAGLVLGAVQLGLCVCLPAGGGGGGKAGVVGGGKGAGGAGVDPRLVSVALTVTPAGRADAGGATPASATSSARKEAQRRLSMARTLSFGQWGEAEQGGGGDGGDGSGWGAAFRAAGRRLSASLLPGGSSRGLGGGSSRGLLGGGGSSRGGRSGGGGNGGGDAAWRAWFSAGGEPSGAPGAALPARAATAGDEEEAGSAAAVRQPPPARTRTFGQFGGRGGA
jgi:hypothetical protein